MSSETIRTFLNGSEQRVELYYCCPVKDLILAQIPLWRYFLDYKKWNIINFSVTAAWQRMWKAPITLAHQKSEKNTISWYLKLGIGIFHRVLERCRLLIFFFWAILLLLFYLKSDRVSGSIAWAIIVLIGESDIRARPNGNQNIMCHQKRSSRTCTKREEEEFALQQTEILCQPLMISLTGVSVKEKIRLIRKCCV